jgi:hypothetical protein
MVAGPIAAKMISRFSRFSCLVFFVAHEEEQP